MSELHDKGMNLTKPGQLRLTQTSGWLEELPPCSRS